MMVWYGNGIGKFGDFMYMYVYMICVFKGLVFNFENVGIFMYVFCYVSRFFVVQLMFLFFVFIEIVDIIEFYFMLNFDFSMYWYLNGLSYLL